jgi:hypothetical protein
MLDLTVIICAHNPRSDYFARVLNGLRSQTLPFHKWELLIVDNASRLPLASSWDISWHPFARHILENELGVAFARRRGIQEASADLIIFVDDDNVLDDTYLEEALEIKHKWPALGVWGSGSIRGDLEVELPESLRKHRSWLPLRELTAPRWSAPCEHPTPWGGDLCVLGAGMCVRKELATAYNRFCDHSSIQITSRQGGSLLTGEDIEIAWICCRHGFGIGIFPELKMTHLIPKHRCSEDYFVRFVEGTWLSGFLLEYKWRHVIPQSPDSIKTLLSVLKTILLYRGVDREMRFAWVRALAKAKKVIDLDLQRNSTTMPAGAPINAPVGADREIASQSVPLSRGANLLL